MHIEIISIHSITLTLLYHFNLELEIISAIKIAAGIKTEIPQRYSAYSRLNLSDTKPNIGPIVKNSILIRRLLREKTVARCDETVF